MTPSHRALRDATADAHARVDSAFAGFDLSDRHGYAAFLAAHAGALLPIEAALDAAGAGQLIDDWPARKRGALLRADLAELGVAPEMPGDFDTLADAGTVAGTLYVLEGSRLGAKFLVRNVPPEFPRRYLGADQLSGNWRNLLDRIDAILSTPDALAQSIPAARAAFDAFERSGNTWLAKV